MIPQAKDGSRFTADLVLPDGTYRVGPKGRESFIQGYEAALDALRKMPKPYWRRPNSRGMFGIVLGVTWVLPS